MRTLLLRAETIITDDKDKEIELKHLKSVLQDDSYKPWMFRIPPNTANTSGTKSEVVSTRAHSFSLPYLQGVSENWLTKFFKKQGVGTFNKPFKTIRQHLVHPKDPTQRERKCGVVYEIQCERCHDFLAIPFGVTFKEHVAITKASTRAVGDHLKRSGHISDMSSSFFDPRARERGGLVQEKN